MAQVFNFDTTSDEVMQTFGDHAKGKYAIITGSNVGLGLETARSLAKAGAIVTVACRTRQLGEEAVASILSEIPDASVSFLQLDLGSFVSIRNFVALYKSSGKPLHLLINNAGVMACKKSFTEDGLETQFGVNHIGHFLLTTELLDLLKQSGTAVSPSRVVTLASLGQYLFQLPEEPIRFDDLKGDAHYSEYERYGSSKLANILFSNELQRRLSASEANVISVSLHPGSILGTNLGRHMDMSKLAGLSAEEVGAYFQSFMRPGTATEPFKNIKQGAATTLLCALDPATVPGAYYSDCQVETVYVHQQANDVQLQKRLWDVSEEIVAAVTGGNK